MEKNESAPTKAFVGLTNIKKNVVFLHMATWEKNWCATFHLRQVYIQVDHQKYQYNRFGPSKKIDFYTD